MNKWEDKFNIPDDIKKIASAVNSKYGLPEGLILRVAAQESSFRPDVISGVTISRSGAVGLMQIVPRWHPNVDPLNPFASMDYAGLILSQWKKRFGTWKNALIAYNWGPTNLYNYKKGLVTSMPRETVNYIREIGLDVNIA